MLRIGFLPSDFNPMLLMLGEANDLRNLAAVLRGFALEPTEMALERLPFCAATRDTRLTLAPGTVVGLRRRSPEADFVWTLDASRADAFADAVEALAHPDCLAGAELLGGEMAGDILVKVSRGEYTDGFLTRPAR